MNELPAVAEEASELFLQLVQDGTPRISAAIQCGWSPQQLTRYLRNEDFAFKVHTAENVRDEAAEKVLYDKAINGHMRALEIWLFNRLPNRWADRKQVDVGGKVQAEIGVVVAVKEAIEGLLSDHGPEALQIGGALDGPIEDAEIVEDGN
jgi:hypothetical protein